MNKRQKRILSIVLALSMIASMAAPGTAYGENAPGDILPGETSSGSIPTPANIGDDVAISSENFPDENFREFVKQYDINSDGVLSQQEIAAVTEMSFGLYEDRQHESLTGIKYFTSLESLICFRTFIESIDVSGMTNLKKLNIWQVGARSLNISGCTSLETLDCSCNYLDTLDVSGLSNLKVLNCSFNTERLDLPDKVTRDPGVYDEGITELNISGCTALEELNVGINQISTLDLSQCPNLKALYCGKTQLNSLDLSNCPDLEILSCYRCPNLTSLGLSCCASLLELNCQGFTGTGLDVSNLTSLRTLDCSFSDLATLNVSGCTALESLICDRVYESGGFKTLDVSGLTALKELRCGECMSLEQLNLTGCTSLETLSCCFNNLSRLDLSSCLNLKSLDCSKNLLSSLDLSKNPLIEELDCGSNDFKTLDLTLLTNLRRIHCDSNALTELKFSSLPQLTALLCFENQLTSLNFAGMPNLEVLNCSKNKLGNLGEISVLTNLRELNCAGNQVKNLDEVSQLTNLKELDCSNNTLAALDLAELNHLEILECSNNPLKSLQLPHHSSLIDLFCTRNQLQQLDLSEQTHLERAYCSDNRLIALNAAGLAKLELLDCSDNRLLRLDLSGTGTDLAPGMQLNVSANGQIQNVSMSKSNRGYEGAIDFPDHVEIGTHLDGTVTWKDGTLWSSGSEVTEAYFSLPITENNDYLTGHLNLIYPSSAPLYNLTVVNGADRTGKGSYEEGERVELSAYLSHDLGPFNRWKSSGGGTFEFPERTDTSFIMPAENVTVTAVFANSVLPEPDIFTVTFDPNGGARLGGGELVQRIEEGQDATLPTVVRPGYTFEGWDGNYKNITADTTVTKDPAGDRYGPSPT